MTAAASPAVRRTAGTTRRPSRKLIILGTLASVALGWTATLATRTTRRHRRSSPSGRIEFVDVDRPGAPVSLAR